MRGKLVLALGLVLGVGACEGKATKGQAKPAVTQAHTAAPSDPISVEEARAVAERYIEALTVCDEAKVEAVIDFRAIAEAAVAQSGADSGFKRGFVSGAAKVGGQALCGSFAGQPNLRLLRILDETTRPRPLVRLISDNGVNYHELELVKHAGKVEVRDMYIYLAGEHLTETFRQLVEAAVGLNSPSATNSAGVAMKELQRLNQAGDVKGAQAKLASLPPAVRQSKAMMLIAVQLASSQSEPEYQAAMDAFAAAFPGDPAVEMVGIDGLFTRKQYGELLASLDRLDARLGGDPYLNVMRASAFIDQEDGAKTVGYLQAAFDAEPALPDVGVALLSLQVEGRDYASAVRTVATLAKHEVLVLEHESLATLPEFEAFVASAPYKTWRKDGTLPPVAPPSTPPPSK